MFFPQHLLQANILLHVVDRQFVLNFFKLIASKSYMYAAVHGMPAERAVKTLCACLVYSLANIQPFLATKAAVSEP